MRAYICYLILILPICSLNSIISLPLENLRIEKLVDIFHEHPDKVTINTTRITNGENRVSATYLVLFLQFDSLWFLSILVLFLKVIFVTQFKGV